MRDHFLRASGVPSSGGSGGSFSRGFYGGAGTSLENSGAFFIPGTWSSTTKEEANAWILRWSTDKTMWSLYYNSFLYQTVITEKELTDASVPSGAKFNKFSTYVWGRVGMSSTNVPKGVRWNMFHTTDTYTTSNAPGYAVKSGENRTLLYQDQASTYFPPFATANSNRAGGDTTIESMQLKGYTTYDGANSSSSGTGLLAEMNAGGGDDSGVSPSSFFTWDGSSDVVVEISTTKASYTTYMWLGLSKHRPWKQDTMYRNDSRDDCHYGSTAWNSSAFATQGSFNSNKKMIHENSSENNDWYDITNSDWDQSLIHI